MKKIIRIGFIIGALFLSLKWMGVNAPDIGFLCFIGTIALMADNLSKIALKITKIYNSSIHRGPVRPSSH